MLWVLLAAGATGGGTGRPHEGSGKVAAGVCTARLAARPGACYTRVERPREEGKEVPCRDQGACEVPLAASPADFPRPCPPCAQVSQTAGSISWELHRGRSVTKGPPLSREPSALCYQALPSIP